MQRTIPKTSILALTIAAGSLTAAVAVAQSGPTQLNRLQAMQLISDLVVAAATAECVSDSDCSAGESCSATATCVATQSLNAVVMMPLTQGEINQAIRMMLRTAYVQAQCSPTQPCGGSNLCLDAGLCVSTATQGGQGWTQTTRGAIMDQIVVAASDDDDIPPDCKSDSDCPGDWICVGIGLCVPPADDSVVAGM